MSAIFKREFRAYFHSMIGFVFLTAFLLIVNFFFMISNLVGQHSTLSGVFGMMLNIILFTVPILTMRIFSEDFKQKTDQLLLTAPVKLGHIVLGKFFAALGVFVLMLAFTLLWVVIIGFFGTPNTAEIVGNYAGILMVAGVFISVGMFISSLTENQLIAAVGAYGVFFVLYILNLIVLSIGSSFPSWAISAFSFLSVFFRFETISRGLLGLDDVIYYLSLTALFLFLCYRVLEKKRWS
jgi:ABC-2 type transport system permease protein